MRPEIDESLLTAYALGELDPSMHAQVALYVRSDEDAAYFVERVRDTAGIVTDLFRAEPIDGLTQLHRDVIEQRLQQAQRAGQSPAHAHRFRRPHWLPFAASMAATFAIVGGTVAYLLSKTNTGPLATGGNSATAPIVAPAQDATAPAPTSEPVDDHFATNAFPGLSAPDAEAELDDADWEPVEGMVDPREAREELAAREPLSPEPLPEAPAPEPEKPAVPPAPAPAVAQGPARSPEAEDVSLSAKNKATASASAKPKKGRKGVYVSPPRDPMSFREIAKSAKVDSAPKVYENSFRTAAQRPRSSFPLRVETGSYNAVRRFLNDNQLPPIHRVRIEELVNRFGYSYPVPADGAALAASIEIATCPWNVSHRLARVAIRTRDGGATVVAKGVEVDVEFNPAATTAWRLIGYENAPVAPSQPAGFKGDLAAGGTATAFYEIVPTSPDARGPASPDLFKLSVVYRDAQEAIDQRVEVTATDTGRGFDRASDDFRFASAVVGFGLLLRDSQYKGAVTFPDVIRWATAGKGPDPTREREAFIEVARKARDLSR